MENKKKYSIRDLADGKCALKNDGTEEEIKLVLNKAFPFDETDIYYEKVVAYQKWDDEEVSMQMYDYDMERILPMQSCAVFLEEIYRQKPLLHSECFKVGMNLDTKPETFEPSCAGNIREYNTGSNQPMANKFQEVANGVANLLTYKNEKYGNSALTPLNIFNGKTKVGQRMDDKIARIQNSVELRKNDIADLIGYLMLVCVENDWATFDEFKD